MFTPDTISLNWTEGFEDGGATEVSSFLSFASKGTTVPRMERPDDLGRAEGAFED